MTKNNLLLAKSLNIGYYLITPLLVGVFLGLFLDDLFETNGIFVTSLIILGTISTFYNLYKLTKEQ